MPEILTESFCERCGTRYTFESVAPRKTKRLGQFKTLSRGVKNWVMSDDSSLDEAMAAARGDEEREATAQQLDAFHSTFNFCMNCRQYTCANCWNPAEGRCLTCSPNLGHEILPAPFPNAAGFEPVRIDAEAWPVAEAWPEADLSTASAGGTTPDVAGAPMAAGNGFHADEPVGATNGTGEEPMPAFDAAARLAFLAGESETADPGGNAAAAEAEVSVAWPEEPTAEPEPAASNVEPVSMAEPVPGDALTDGADQGIAAEAETATSTPDDTDRRAAELASRTSSLLGRFRPGQSLDAEIAAYEARLEAEEAAGANEPDLAAAAEVAAAAAAAAESVAGPEPVSEPQPVTELEPVAAAATTEPEPIAAQPAVEPQPVAAERERIAAEREPEPEPAAATEPGPAAAARDDVVEQPTWRIFAPDPTTPAQPGAPGSGAPAGTPAQASGEPEWPANPELEQSPSMALFANRDRVSSDALWAASAREVLGGPVGPTPAPTLAIQPCSNCGLSLSANARFCRRCGTRQG